MARSVALEADSDDVFTQNRNKYFGNGAYKIFLSTVKRIGIGYHPVSDSCSS